MKKFLILITILLYCLTTFCACTLNKTLKTPQNDNNNQEQKQEQSQEQVDNIYGTYYFVQAEEDGTIWRIGDILEGVVLTKNYMTITINSDGTGTFGIETEVPISFVQEEGGYGIYVLDNSILVKYFDVKIENSTMTLHMLQANDEIVVLAKE